ncbi:MAG: hypothetical protein FJ276_17230 [Planctomycetes bacterium]|nr:hypothetical protein [Planctomycetota bacterium]
MSILVSERYFFFMGHTVVIVISMIAERACRVRVFVGGGKHGWLGLSWGAHSWRMKRTAKAIRQLCDTKSWALSIEQDPFGKSWIDWVTG